MEFDEMMSELAEKKTLRDEFAMAALTGLMSAADQNNIWTCNTTNAVRWAYEAADAMLEARKQKS